MTWSKYCWIVLKEEYIGRNKEGSSMRGKDEQGRVKKELTKSNTANSQN